MDKDEIKKEVGKIRKFILNGGREYTGKVVSVSDVNKTNVLVHLKDKYGIIIKFLSSDVMAVEEILV